MDERLMKIFADANKQMAEVRGQIDTALAKSQKAIEEVRSMEKPDTSEFEKAVASYRASSDEVEAALAKGEKTIEGVQSLPVIDTSDLDTAMAKFNATMRK